MSKLKSRVPVFMLPALMAHGHARAEEQPTPVRSRADEADLALMKRADPKAVELLLEGEAVFARGQTEQAERLLRSAREQAPIRALPARRHCQALARLGKRTEAVEACEVAFQRGASPLEQRALVGAVLSGSTPPTTQDLWRAFQLAEAAKQQMKHQPWGYAAECDIARRLGKKEMLGACLAELRRRAPGHAETRRAEALAMTGGSNWLLVVPLLLAWAGTLIHAGYRRFRRFGTSAASAMLVALVLANPANAQDAGAGTPQPRGEPISSLAINHDDPERSLPTPEQRDRDPLQFGYHLMDLTEAGTAASQRGDHQKAVKYFVALAKAVPDVSRGYMLACSEYEALGNRDEALKFCTTGIALNGARLLDYKLYTRVMLQKPGPLLPDEVRELGEVIGHLRKEPAGVAIAEDAECGLALRLEDPKRLEQCVNVLRMREPEGAATLTHELALALAKRDIAAANGVIARAKRTPTIPREAIRRMERARDGSASLVRRMLAEPRLLGIPVALVLALLGLGIVMRRRRESPPSVSSAV
jgi:tetratricopeptide (TPR) repeat protein